MRINLALVSFLMQSLAVRRLTPASEAISCSPGQHCPLSLPLFRAWLNSTEYTDHADGPHCLLIVVSRDIGVDLVLICFIVASRGRKPGRASGPHPAPGQRLIMFGTRPPPLSV